MTDNDYNVYKLLKINLVHYAVVVINYNVVAIDSLMMWLCGKSRNTPSSLLYLPDDIALFSWWNNVMITSRMDDKLEELKAYFNLKFNEQEKKIN